MYIYTESFTMIFCFKIGTYKEFSFHSAPIFVYFRYNSKMTYINVLFLNNQYSLNDNYLKKLIDLIFVRKKINISQN